MTLIDTLPPSNENQSADTVVKKDTEEETEEKEIYQNDNESCYDENDTYALQQSNGDDLLQNLGCPSNSNFLTNFTNGGGSISVENSTDVHFGDKNIYQGPVTIKQIVYANDLARLKNDSNNTSSILNDNNEIQTDSISGKSGHYCTDGAGSYNSKLNNRFTSYKPSSTVTDQTTPRSRLRKGIIRVQKFVKHKPFQTGICLSLIVILLIVIITLIIQYFPNPKRSENGDILGPPFIQPPEYDQDITSNQITASKLKIISRVEWVAQPPAKASEPLATPVPYVVIHQTATENCSSHAQCVLHVRFLQTFDIESKGFSDIGYNFFVGGDGAVYEGRGWKTQGDRYYDYNSQGILIAFIGTFYRIKPTSIQIVTCQKLISEGVKIGNIKENYKLIVDKSVTKVNNSALYNEIKTWPHWVNI